MNKTLRGAVKVALGFPGFDVAEALCSRSNCGGIAAWRVGVRAWAPKTVHRQNNYISIQFPLTVCDSCKAKVVVPDVIDNRGWRKIVKAVRSRDLAKPDRTSLQLEFEPLSMGTA